MILGFPDDAGSPEKPQGPVLGLVGGHVLKLQVARGRARHGVVKGDGIEHGLLGHFQLGGAFNGSFRHPGRPVANVRDV